ncbi:MAG TPA: protein kinase [Polyangiaceae bacterium]|jgi:serine/threonine-protein kinase
MAESPVSVGQILAEKYRVERIIGSGGMGIVVAAWHLVLEQLVAVKFLHPLALENKDSAERFRREARAAAKIRSEHVARVIDVGTMGDGLPYMVMEYLDGHDMSQEMMERGQIPIVEACDYMLQAIEALAEAHAAGIVHRDLKPANLFLANRPDGTRAVKVLDFGISKSLVGSSSVSDLALTRTATLIGSPLYMSPEQMRAPKDVDTRTDIWSLGVILYELLSAEPPYTGDSIPALCAALLSDTPRSLRQLRPDLPPELEEHVMRCLMKNPAQRWPTVSDLAIALSAFGSAYSGAHVERATRVLRASDDFSSGDFGSGPRIPVVSTLQGAGRAGSSPRLENIAGRAPISETIGTWDQGSVRPTSRRRLSILASALLIVGLAAGGAYLGLRSRVEPTNHVVDLDAPRAASEAPPSTVTAVTTPVAAIPRAPSPILPEPSAVPVEPSVRTPPRAAKPAARTPAAKPSAPPQAPPPQKPTPGGSAGISDFGGRQ